MHFGTVSAHRRKRLAAIGQLSTPTISLAAYDEHFAGAVTIHGRVWRTLVALRPLAPLLALVPMLVAVASVVLDVVLFEFFGAFLLARFPPSV